MTPFDIRPYTPKPHPSLPNATAPLVSRVRAIHGGKTLRDHLMRVRAIRENVRKAKAKGGKG